MQKGSKFFSTTFFNSLVIFVAIIVWLLINFLHIQQKERDALNYGQQTVEQVLNVQTAILRYVEADQKPAAFELMAQSQSDEGYFDPRLLSGTHVARRIQEELNNERKAGGQKPLKVKLAAVNARNPINEASESEALLLESFKSGELTHHHEIRTDSDGDKFYSAIPMFRYSKTCMGCHGNPNDAPKQLIDIYGAERAFGKQIGDIPAIISIEVPLAELSQYKLKDKVIYAGQSAVLISLMALPFLWFNSVISNKNRKLELLSQTDALTLLLNRRAFSVHLENEVAKAKRHKSTTSFIMLDLDKFKHINDKHGHLIGDKVLVAFSQILKRQTRKTDFVARWGGEEFMILLTNTDLEDAVNYAEKIQNKMYITDFAEGVKVTASFGIAQLHPNETIEELLFRLDTALYAAKEAGRDLIKLARF